MKDTFEEIREIVIKELKCSAHNMEHVDRVYNLGWTFIIKHWEGHMWSHMFNQPYLEFPLVKQLCTKP